MIVDDIRAGMILITSSPFMKHSYLLIEELSNEVNNSGNFALIARGSRDGENWLATDQYDRYIVAQFYDFLQYEESKKPAPETSRLADVE